MHSPAPQRDRLSIQRQVQSFIQRRFFYNERLQNLVWRKYYTPNAKTPSVVISKRAQAHLEELREEGVTVVHGFESVADHIENTYFSVIEGRQKDSSQTLEKTDLGERDDITNSEHYRVSFKDPGLAPMLFDPDVCGILYNYYQRQPYYRGQPRVIKNAMSKDITFEQFSKLEVSAKFHTDYYRQIAMMFLVNDLSESDTHLEYAVKSHKDRHSWKRYSYDDLNVQEQYAIKHCVGPRGSLILMDAGSGLHRGAHKKGTVRKILHCLVTTGHYFPEEDEKMSVADWPALSNCPDYVRHMIDDLRTE
jgi:hypothetical protein